MAPWPHARTGKPITLLAWRGTTKSTPLTPEWRAKTGRDVLLGDGLYASPSSTSAAKFGDVVQARISLHNPYVIEKGAPSDFVIGGLDPEALKAQGHDGLAIKGGTSGSSLGNEPMAQVVLWAHPDEGKAILGEGRRPGEMEVGATVALQPTSAHLAARLGGAETAKITGFSPWGHAEVRVGGAKVGLTAADHTVLMDAAPERRSAAKTRTAAAASLVGTALARRLAAPPAAEPDQERPSFGMR